MILAQLPNPSVAQSIGWLVLSIASLAVALRAIIGLWRDVNRPSGADVQAESSARYQPKGDYATRQDLVALEARISAMARSSDESREALRTHIDAKVDALREQLSDRIDSQAAEFGNALRDQPMKIVALLHNTGNLK